MYFQGANDSRLVLIYGTQKKMRWFRLGSIMSNGKRLKITYGESSILIRWRKKKVLAKNVHIDKSEKQKYIYKGENCRSKALPKR